jgi:formate dehydrogenase major subunit
VPGLGTTLGRGGATTAQQDLANADAILIMGSSMAENHPVGFQWVMEARERNRATVIHVDPRFTRTSAMADIWVPLRAGTDILFLGGLIRYAIENDKYFREYVAHYTNAAMIVRDGFRDTEELDGVFSGWQEDKKKYDPETWKPQAAQSDAAPLTDYDTDPTLEHPSCVFQILRRHFARYTPEMVEQHAGVPQKLFLKVAEAFCNASGPDKTGAICYAVGWTQHSKGVQIIRAAAILQLLLGNIGRPGGGILALRGHASIQGSTDIPTLFDMLPGYLPMPFFSDGIYSLADYLKKNVAGAGIWSNFESYIVSLLKSFYGENARADNDWGFDYLPRVTGDHSHFGYWTEMMDGKLDGLFIMGENPAVGAPNARFQRTAMSKLKWLVVRDLVEIESASWWYNSPEVKRGELRPEDIGTEIFLFPAAGSAEKEGCQTNTQRLVQFRTAAVNPPGDARSEAWFMHHLAKRLKAKAAADPRPRNVSLNALTWPYGTHGIHEEPNISDILKEINGRDLTTGELLKSYHALKSDGSTACGCWIYSGIYPQEHLNKANQREPVDYLGHGWGFAWPNDVRILYNRCSARPDGKPWSERKKLVWWDESKREWTGHDVPDFEKNKPPDYRALKGAKGMEAISGDKPFILHPDGLGWIFVTSGLKDGPLPAHYEPLESPFGNALYPEHPTNPTAQRMERPDNRYAAPCDERFPYVLTTYRLTEHHTAGGMSRFLPHLAELQPELFCEVSPELAGSVGLHHGEFATIFTPRGIVQARVLVTPRIRPLQVRGKTVHQVGLPYHWGFEGMVTGDVVNDLLAISEEPNVRIMETKALVCDIQPGARARGPQALEQLESKWEEPA